MKAIRIMICALITFCVAAHGAVESWSVGIFELTAAAIFLFWGIEVARGKTSEIFGSPVLWPLAGLELIVLVQLFGRFTLYPYLTKAELLLLTSYLLIAFLAVQAFRTPRQWRGFTWFLIWLGFIVGVFAILQELTSNGKLYWVRELSASSVSFGPFVNRNHFAGLMELLIPFGLAMLATKAVLRQQIPLTGFCTAMAAGALCLSASRGGIFSFGIEILLLVAVLTFSRGEKRPMVLGMAVLALTAVLVAWLGVGQIVQRFSEIHNPEVTENRRISIARDAWHIFLDHPAMGTGLGTTISVFPLYETIYDGKVIDHAHNDHLELLAETGIPGGLCWIAFIALLGFFGLRNFSIARDPAVRAVHLASVVACAGLLVHGLMDFNLHIPSNALLFYVLAAIGASSPIDVARADNARMLEVRANRRAERVPIVR
jgi:O-antigen ligase